MPLTKQDFLVEFDLEEIKNRLGKKRYKHTIYVLEAASKLAKKLNINLKKVKTAALLHDIAKSKNSEELNSILKDSKWDIDEMEAAIFPILHAPAGAVLAEKEFGIEDQEVLEAIRYHTLGHPEMSKIAQVIYAADFISEDRDFVGLEEIRIEIEKNFEYGLYLITSEIINYQLKQDKFVHPYSNDFRNKLLREVINKC